MPLMKPLPKDIAAIVGPHLQDALDKVGGCIDLLQRETIPYGAKTEWILTLARAQDTLCDLTINANRSARNNRSA